MINEEQIKYYANQYYQGNEIISDEEYDALIDQLRKENSRSKILPENQGITGSDLKGIDKEYKLDISMGTLEKCNTDTQFKEWWSKHSHSDIVAQSKIDGCLDGDTILETSEGNFTIKEIVEKKKKCKVKAFDIQKNKEIYTPILDWYINENSFSWYEIELENGQKIKVTENHKFFLQDLNCWREAGKLNIGDELKIDQQFLVQ